MSDFDPISHALEVFRSGQKEVARTMLRELVAREPDNAAGWRAMARVAATRREALNSLEQVLRLEPGDEWAQRQLERLMSGAAPRRPAPTGPLDRVRAFWNAGATGKLVLGGLGLLAAAFLVGLALAIPSLASLAAAAGSPLGAASPTPPPSTARATSTVPATEASAPATRTSTPSVALEEEAEENAPTGVPSRTPRPTSRPLPSATSTAAPTSTTAPSATPTPTASPTLTSTPLPDYSLSPYPTPTDPNKPNNVPTDAPIPDVPCDCYSFDLDCSDFGNRNQAQACYDHCLEETGQDVHSLDGNNDGVACEP